MRDDITVSSYSNSLSTHGAGRIGYGNVTIYRTSVGPMDNNAYLLVGSYEPGNPLPTDTTTDAEHLIRLVGHVGAQVRTIVTTHFHGDHVQALDELLQAFPARHITSSLDAAGIPKPADQQFDGGETIMFGQGITLPTFILCGYIRGGLCLDLSTRAASALSDDTPSHHLFVGDGILSGGVGKTYSPEGSSQFIGDVEIRVFHVCLINSVIHFGHGKDTIAGVESLEVRSWRQRGW